MKIWLHKIDGLINKYMKYSADEWLSEEVNK